MEDTRPSDNSTLTTPPSHLQDAQKLPTLGRSPKVLFLSLPFPPFRATACVRTWNIAKYLARVDWDVTVVTPFPSLWRNVDNPEKVAAEVEREGIRQIFTDHRWRCLSPDHLNCWNESLGWVAGGICRRIAQQLGIDKGIGWIKAAERACSHLTPNDVDVILATAPPFAAFLLAKRLSDRLGRPYVLDYRDLWSKNAHDPMPTVAKEEAKLLAGAAAITTVSPSWGSIMDQNFGVGSKLQIVPNGYDPEELCDIQAHDFGHFAIVYAGAFYPPARVISPVMAALSSLKETTNGKRAEWFFHYYGSHESHVREQAERFGVTERIVLHGSVPRTEALSATRGAGVAVVITSVAQEASVEEKGIMTGKVYESLGLGARILSIAPLGSDIRTIDERSGMARTFTGNDTKGIALFLEEAMSGRPLKPTNRDLHSWPKIVEKMDCVLRIMAAGLQKERRP
jgi:glycosyltransferase involved in cell wall biosynthesis